MADESASSPVRQEALYLPLSRKHAHPFGAIFMCTICLHLNIFVLLQVGPPLQLYLCEANWWRRNVIATLVGPTPYPWRFQNQILTAFNIKMVILCNITSTKWQTFVLCYCSAPPKESSVSVCGTINISARESRTALSVEAPASDKDKAKRTRMGWRTETVDFVVVGYDQKYYNL